MHLRFIPLFLVTLMMAPAALAVDPAPGGLPRGCGILDPAAPEEMRTTPGFLVLLALDDGLVLCDFGPAAEQPTPPSGLAEGRLPPGCGDAGCVLDADDIPDCPDNCSLGNLETRFESHTFLAVSQKCRSDTVQTFCKHHGRICTLWVWGICLLYV